MAEPSFLSGTEPKATDTRWLRWVKILGAYQDKAGALACNDPVRSDTLRTLKRKVLASVRGECYG